MTRHKIVACDNCGLEDTTPPYPYHTGELRIELSFRGTTIVQLYDLCSNDLLKYLNDFDKTLGGLTEDKFGCAVSDLRRKLHESTENF